MTSVEGSLGNNAGGGKVRSDMSDVPEGFVLPSGDDNRTDSGTVYGPTLFNIYGRASGEAEIAQKNIMGARAKGLIWDDANLMRYMKNPRQTAGVNVQMNFRGIDDFQTRVDIVHYLKTLTLGHSLELWV
eukprot:s2937_g3.t1